MVDDDTISTAFPSNNYQSSNSNEIDMVEVAKKDRKHLFDKLSDSNKSEETTLNKTIRVLSKVS